MTRMQFLMGLFLTIMGGVFGAADQPGTKSSAPASGIAKADNALIIVYYFHGTIRCATCQKIERLAQEAIEKRFVVEVAAKRLLFQPVNYDKPENAHFLDDYKLPCPSLVVVRQKEGRDEKWKLLDKTWKLVEDPIGFNKYIESETSKLLNAAKQPRIHGWNEGSWSDVSSKSVCRHAFCGLASMVLSGGNQNRHATARAQPDWL